MRRNKIVALCLALAAVLAVGWSGARPAGAAQARLVPAATCGWSVVPSPSPGTAQDQLTGVAAISPTDVWAVGDYYNGNSALLTLVEHWDGTQWSVVPSPSPGGTHFAQVSVLSAVTAITAGNIWAVGYFNSDPLFMPNRTLIEHWDGTRWGIVGAC